MKKFILVPTLVIALVVSSIASIASAEDGDNSAGSSRGAEFSKESCITAENGRMIIYATAYCCSHAKTVAEEVKVFLENEAVLERGFWRNPDNGNTYIIPTPK